MEASGCWLWSGTIDLRSGTPVIYSRQRKEKISTSARKFSYSLIMREEIQPRAMFRVSCGNAMCVYPGHLVPSRSPLAPEQVEEMRYLYAAGGTTLKQLGEKYSLHFDSVSRIVRGERYADVGGPIASRRRQTRTHCANGHPWPEHPSRDLRTGHRRCLVCRRISKK